MTYPHARAHGGVQQAGEVAQRRAHGSSLPSSARPRPQPGHLARRLRLPTADQRQVHLLPVCGCTSEVARIVWIITGSVTVQDRDEYLSNV